jgi:hypothetical protein
MISFAPPCAVLAAHVLAIVGLIGLALPPRRDVVITIVRPVGTLLARRPSS